MTLTAPVPATMSVQAAVKVPVITSSLLQLPALLALYDKVGVLTISSSKLGIDRHPEIDQSVAAPVDSQQFLPGLCLNGF